MSIEKEEEDENEEKLLKKNKESSRAKIGKYIKVNTRRIIQDMKGEINDF